MLSFLQQGLERILSTSTLEVYIAAISTHHDPIEGKSVGKHDLVVRFLRGARRLNPPRPSSSLSWDLALVLRALQTALFEPLQSVELKFKIKYGSGLVPCSIFTGLFGCTNFWTCEYL